MNIETILKRNNRNSLVTEKEIHALFHGFKTLLEQIPDSDISEAIRSKADGFLISKTKEPEQMVRALHGACTIASWSVSGADKLFHVSNYLTVSKMLLLLNIETFVLVTDNSPNILDFFYLENLFNGEVAIFGNKIMVPTSALM